MVVFVWFFFRGEGGRFFYLLVFFLFVCSFLACKETCTIIKLCCLVAFGTLTKEIYIWIHFSQSQKVHALVQGRCHNKLASNLNAKTASWMSLVMRPMSGLYEQQANICWKFFIIWLWDVLMNLIIDSKGKRLLAQWSDAGIKCIFIFARLLNLPSVY